MVIKFEPMTSCILFKPLTTRPLLVITLKKLFIKSLKTIIQIILLFNSMLRVNKNSNNNNDTIIYNYLNIFIFNYNYFKIFLTFILEL